MRNDREGWICLTIAGLMMWFAQSHSPYDPWVALGTLAGGVMLDSGAYWLLTMGAVVLGLLGVRRLLKSANAPR